MVAKPKPTKKAKKANNPPINKESILARRHNLLCDCGCGQEGHDLHHCFIGRKKGYPELDDERNLVLVNHAEHISRAFDNKKWRVKFWKVQCERYGIDEMLDWIRIIPEKMLSRMDWI